MKFYYLASYPNAYTCSSLHAKFLGSALKHSRHCTSLHCPTLLGACRNRTFYALVFSLISLTPPLCRIHTYTYIDIYSDIPKYCASDRMDKTLISGNFWKMRDLLPWFSFLEKSRNSSLHNILSNRTLFLIRDQDKKIPAPKILILDYKNKCHGLS